MFDDTLLEVSDVVDVLIAYFLVEPGPAHGGARLSTSEQVQASCDTLSEYSHPFTFEVQTVFHKMIINRYL